MKQKKRCIGSLQEYPGSTIWYDYEVLCPECQQWCKDFGEVDIEIDGEWHQLCITCGNAVWMEAEDV